jgi:hypothetical protein
MQPPSASTPVPSDRSPAWKKWLLIAALVAVPLLLIGFVVQAVLREKREELRRYACANNLKQIALGLATYEARYGRLPPAQMIDRNGNKHSWRVLILPFLEQGDLYAQYHFDEPWDSPHNRLLASKAPPFYRCRSDSADASETSYVMIVGARTISDMPTGRRFWGIPDGSAGTIEVVECAGAKIGWSEPRDLAFEDLDLGFGVPGKTPGSNHSGVIVAAFADCHIGYIPKECSIEEFKGAVTIDDGKAAPW